MSQSEVVPPDGGWAEPRPTKLGTPFVAPRNGCRAGLIRLPVPRGVTHRYVTTQLCHNFEIAKTLQIKGVSRRHNYFPPERGRGGSGSSSPGGRGEAAVCYHFQHGSE